MLFTEYPVRFAILFSNIKGEAMETKHFFRIGLGLLVGMPFVLYFINKLNAKYKKQAFDISTLVGMIFGALGCGVMTYLSLQKAIDWLCLTLFVAVVMAVISFWINYFGAWMGDPVNWEDDDRYDDDGPMHGKP
jgi:hypothetical protein